MENNPEHIPSAILDWLEQFSFNALSPAQQKEVLLHLSVQDYDELHEAVMGIKSVRPDEAGGREKIKEELMLHFDARHATGTKVFRLLSNPPALWKAAAIFLLFGCGWLCYQFMMQYKQQTSAFVSYSDTVYITKEVRQEPVRIYDTVYISQEVSTPSGHRSGHQSPHTSRMPGRRENQLNSPPTDIHVLSIRELESEPNKIKRNSVKDDSLIRKFPFVTL